MIKYKIFKGLQKPLEFMGFKGRYVWVGLGSILASIIVFVGTLMLINTATALVTTIILLGSTFLWIYKNMNRGLHSKKKDNSIYIVYKTME